MEVSFSNACNFACSYCSPEISSKWMEDINKYGQYPTKHGAHNLDYLKSSGKYPYKHSEDNPYVTAFWKWFPDLYKTLQTFRITGGEPLLTKDTFKVLDYINNINDLNYLKQLEERQHLLSKNYQERQFLDY